MNRALRIVVATVIAWWAGLAFAPVFGPFPGPRPFLLAVTASVGVGLLVPLLLRRSAVAAAGVGTMAVVTVALFATGAGVDVVHGPWRLVTAALPVDPAGGALAAVGVVVGWAALAAALPAGFGRGPLVPLIGPLATLGLALAVTASAVPVPGWYGAVLVALLALHLLLARMPAVHRVRSPWRSGPIGPALGAAALATVVAALLGPLAPGVGDRPPADVRALIAAPIQPRSGVSPLQQYLALRDGTRPLTLTGSVSRPGAPLRMATLTHFDGTYWTVGGDFRVAGRTLPPDPAQLDGATGDPVTQTVTVEAGDLDWLVTAGRPTTVSVAGLGVDQTTGDVAVPLGNTPPRDYRATSMASPSTVDQLSAGQPAAAAQAPPALPAALASFLHTAVADQSDPLGQLVSLYHRLASSGEFRYDEAAEVPGGHGYYQLLRLLDTRRGTSEQYASAYAVMARALGYDARVVLGFRPDYDGDSFVATGADVAAWVEVRFERIGWVAVDPSPRTNPIGTRAEAPAVGAAAGPATPPPTGAVDETDAAPPTRTQPAGANAVTGPGLVVSAVAAVLVLALLVSVGPAARGARRARRRRAGSARIAVLGSWWETMAALRRVGLPAGPALTTGEVRRLAAAAPGLGSRLAGPLDELASIVDEAAFAPGEPATAVRARAWAIESVVRQETRRHTARFRRLVSFVNPRR